MCAVNHAWVIGFSLLEAEWKTSFFCVRKGVRVCVRESRSRLCGLAGAAMPLWVPWLASPRSASRDPIDPRLVCRVRWVDGEGFDREAGEAAGQGAAPGIRSNFSSAPFLLWGIGGKIGGGSFPERSFGRPYARG